jgi:hypothetical protein
MAQMHPRAGPVEGTTSAAERQLYALLRDRLDDTWHVIHGAERYFKATKGRLVRGEIDFLLVHPDYGVAVVEVKGGQIQRDSATGKWFSVDREGVAHPLSPSPFQQVDESARHLRYFLTKAPETQPFHYDLIKLAWFFSIEWAPLHLAEFPDELILDNRHLGQPQSAIQAAFRFAGMAPTPGKVSPEAVAALIARFDPEMAAPTLADEIRIDARTIDRLTLAQCNRLDAILRLRRCVVPGEAGTGKTILAFETARLLAAKGQRTLFACVNEFQAEWLREKQATECDIDREAFDIFDLRALGAALAQEAGTAGVANDPAQIVSGRGQMALAQSIQRSRDRLRQRADGAWGYDAIIADEGQDIQPPLLSALGNLLRQPAQGVFVIWHDARQRLDFDDAWKAPGSLPSVPALTENLRNTRAVVDLLATFNPALSLFPFNGPEGRPIVYRDPAATQAPNPDLATQTLLHDTLARLIGQEGIAPGAIMIITARTNAASQWKQWRTAFTDIPLRPLTQWRQTPAEERDGYVKIATIRAAKGLESDVVILVEPDGVAQEAPARHDKLLYVALSRARHHLIVLGSPASVAPLGTI